MTSLDLWLSEATKGLSAESSARVRAEIQEHYDSAREAGSDADAILGLGDPEAANREYRKVLLTEKEALMAPILTRSEPRTLQSLVFPTLLLAVIVGMLLRRPQDLGSWLVLGAIWCTAPLNWFFSVNTLERSRVYLYVRAIHLLVVISAAWWYQGWFDALILGAMCTSGDYLNGYRRLSIFRKLAAGQTYQTVAQEQSLTPLEVIHLRMLEKGSPNEAVLVTLLLFLPFGTMTFWQPAGFAPVTICMIGGFVAQRTMAVYTEEGSRWFRIAKWASMAVAGMLPFLLGARAPWVGAFYLAFFFVLFDMRSISLRRKLPVAEWPKRLYW